MNKNPYPGLDRAAAPIRHVAAMASTAGASLVAEGGEEDLRLFRSPESIVQPTPVRDRAAAVYADLRAHQLRILALLVMVAAALTLGGCGGGGGGGDRSSGFINFTNAPDGEIVLDADNDVFRVTEREGCLWSDQYGFVTNWCLVGSGSRLDFGAYFVVLVSHPGRFGGCVTVLAEERSLLIVDIFVNANGIMDYAISNIPALRC